MSYLNFPIDLKQWQQLAEKFARTGIKQISQFNQHLAASKLKLTYQQLKEDY